MKTLGELTIDAGQLRARECNAGNENKEAMRTSVRTGPEPANEQGTVGLSVLLWDLGRGLGLATYRGPSLSRRGNLGPGPIHSDQSNTLSTHFTYLTSEGEAQPFSLNIPVQNSMNPVICHLVP